MRGWVQLVVHSRSGLQKYSAKLWLTAVLVSKVGQRLVSVDLRTRLVSGHLLPDRIDKDVAQDNVHRRHATGMVQSGQCSGRGQHPAPQYPPLVR